MWTRQLAAALAAPPERALALPPTAWRDPALFEAEMAMIQRDWVVVGLAKDLPEPGQWRSLSVGGEPAALIRGRDRQLRLLSNVCRHRGRCCWRAPVARIGWSAPTTRGPTRPTVCERMQRASRARRWSGGQLVPLERIVGDFHRYLRERLTLSAP